MMTLGNLVTVQKFSCCAVTVIQKCFFTASARVFAQYNPSYVNPNPDPEFYRNNPPDSNDEIAVLPVKAAPTSQTYSNFYDEKVLKLEKLILKKGNSATARRIVRGALLYIKTVQVKKYHRAALQDRDSIELNPYTIFHQALENSKPLLDLKRVERGGQAYRVPVVMQPEKQFFFVIKAMTNHVWSGKPNTDAAERLGKEILAAYNNDGAAVKAKQNLHKQAYANRAYSSLTR